MTIFETNKFLFLFCFLFLVFSCKKQEKEVAYKITDTKSLEKLFQLKNYKNQKKTKINDSVMHIKANNGNFFIEGDMDLKLNEKMGTWTLTRKNGLKNIEIDYIPFGKKDVHRNQILFYDDKGMLDSLNSKFYTSKVINDGNKKYVEFSFFSPRNPNEKFGEASLHYSIGKKSGKIKDDLIILKDGNGIYRVKIDFDFTGFKKKEGIAGYFSEFVESKVSGDSIAMGNNTIFFKKDF